MEVGDEREIVWGVRGDTDRCWLGWWGEDKSRVVSKWAASPSPTSISRHSPSALPCTLYPRSYTPSLRSPWEQESSLSALEFLPLAADLLTPVPLPSAHHSSSLSPLQHTLDECNSYESGSVLLTRLIRPQAVLSLRCHKPLVKHVVVGWTPVAFQWVPANDELIWLIIYYVLSRICICYQAHVLMHEDVTQPTSTFHSGFHANKMLM